MPAPLKNLAPESRLTMANLTAFLIGMFLELARCCLAAKQHLASSKNMPMRNAVRLAMVRRDSGARFFNGAGMKNHQVSPAQAPSISPGGVVPIDSTVNTIQPGEWVDR